jgi:hypothetical protein
MKLRCDNCGRKYADDSELACVFPDIPDLCARIDPGGTVPHGECPECGGLVYAEADTGYLVCWSVNLWADSFREAAEQALRMQRDPGSTAVVFDIIDSATGDRETVDLLEDPLAASFRCRVCGDAVEPRQLRSHLESHNPNTRGLDWEEVLSLFEAEAGGAGQEPEGTPVVLAVHGGVAEVLACPAGVEVEIRDYDTEGCPAQDLAADGAVVARVRGPVGGHAEMKDVKRFSGAVASVLVEYQHREEHGTWTDADKGERCWTVETAAGPLSVTVLRFCNAADIASVFLRFGEVKRASALGLPGLNACSGKWNIHEVSAKAGRGALEAEAIATLRARLERVGVRRPSKQCSRLHADLPMSPIGAHPSAS